MVRMMRSRGQIESDAVERAFLHVLRHLLLPAETPIAEVYRDTTIVLKRAETDYILPAGRTLSSSTMPGLLARILESSKLTAGMRVLQIGTGSGYLAALIAELVGEDGFVTTVEIDEEIAHFARDRMGSLGYSNVCCVAADGSKGFIESAPFDRIISTELGYFEIIVNKVCAI